MSRNTGIILFAFLVLVVICAEGWTAEPTLARLSFRVPPDRMAVFEAVYQEKILPVLNAHGLRPSPTPGRTTVKDVFSRLFALTSIAELASRGKALKEDATLTAILRDLVASGLLRQEAQGSGSGNDYRFKLYSTPAGAGKMAFAGPGRGHWRTFDGSDGLGGVYVRSLMQDREGNLWVGFVPGGVSRYDGRTWTTFTRADGLGYDMVDGILQDREGNFWFCSEGGGVSRYDGERFSTFTTREGLANNSVWSIIQDREGLLWFGTGEGVKPA